MADNNMTLDEYQRLAQKTSNCLTLSSKIENGVLGLCGETGECADILKSIYFRGTNLTRSI